MAKLNSKNINIVKEVSKNSEEKSNILTIKIIDNKDLFDYPKNNEDITRTEDLEVSIRENGFTDPMEVTDFGMESGKYMIISGHRRRRAGVKVGISKFPCIIRHFETEKELRNYVLLSNSQRDSSKDPLLYCKRYRMHMEYLSDYNLSKGEMREQIAKRLGMSTQQAERYDRFNRVIIPFWDLVREEKVGLSNLLPLATLSEDDQHELYKIIVQCIEKNIEPTRSRCKSIIDRYKDGIRDFNQLIQEESKIVKPVSAAAGAGTSILNINTDIKERVEADNTVNNPLKRNDEINYDFSHREIADNQTDAGNKKYKGEKLTQEDYLAIEQARANENREKTDTDESIEKGEKIQKSLSQCLVRLRGYYGFRSTEEKIDFIKLLNDMTQQTINEIYDLSCDEKVKKECDKMLKELKNSINKICKVVEKKDR